MCKLRELTGVGRIFNIASMELCTPERGYGCDECLQAYKDSGLLEQMIKEHQQTLRDFKNNDLGKYYF